MCSSCAPKNALHLPMLLHPPQQRGRHQTTPCALCQCLTPFGALVAHATERSKQEPPLGATCVAMTSWECTGGKQPRRTIGHGQGVAPRLRALAPVRGLAAGAGQKSWSLGTSPGKLCCTTVGAFDRVVNLLILTSQRYYVKEILNSEADKSNGVEKGGAFLREERL